MDRIGAIATIVEISVDDRVQLLPQVGGQQSRHRFVPVSASRAISDCRQPFGESVGKLARMRGPFDLRLRERVFDRIGNAGAAGDPLDFDFAPSHRLSNVGRILGPYVVQDDFGENPAGRADQLSAFAVCSDPGDRHDAGTAKPRCQQRRQFVRWGCALGGQCHSNFGSLVLAGGELEMPAGIVTAVASPQSDTGPQQPQVVGVVVRCVEIELVRQRHVGDSHDPTQIGHYGIVGRLVLALEFRDVGGVRCHPLAPSFGLRHSQHFQQIVD